MKPPHSASYRARGNSDAIGLLAVENQILSQLFAKWDTTTPSRDQGSDVASTKWDHGTIGKLLLEHAAVRLAAAEDIARVMRKIGRDREASKLDLESQALRPILGRMFECSQGVQPISVSIAPNFVEAVKSLQELLRPKLAGERENLEIFELSAALGKARDKLRSDKFILKHAPTHPRPVRRWYERIPLLVRIHVAWDRLAGYPWSESGAGDRELAKRFDRET